MPRWITIVAVFSVILTELVNFAGFISPRSIPELYPLLCRFVNSFPPFPPLSVQTRVLKSLSQDLLVACQLTELSPGQEPDGGSGGVQAVRVWLWGGVGRGVVTTISYN